MLLGGGGNEAVETFRLLQFDQVVNEAADQDVAPRPQSLQILDALVVLRNCFDKMRIELSWSRSSDRQVS